MVEYRILKNILDKVENTKQINDNVKKKYLRNNDNTLIFESIFQLEVIYIALVEFAPQLISRDSNFDKNHSYRLEYEKNKVSKSVKFFLDDTHINKDDVNISLANETGLIQSMIQTQNQALNMHIIELKKYCKHYEYSTRQQEKTVTFLREAMMQIASRDIELDQELNELKNILEKTQPLLTIKEKIDNYFRNKHWI